MERNQIPLYVLNSFLKFERKLYHIFGLPIGRPIRFKSILYFIVFALIIAVIYFMPIVGNLINWLPISVLAVIPVGLAWLLADIGTEDRVPMNFFRSFIKYQIRKLKGDSFFRGRKVAKERDYSFNNYYSYQEVIRPIDQSEIEAENEAEKERKKALKYMERIAKPDEFFERLRKQKEAEELARQKNKRKWFIFKKGA